jgi:hypothetical protein
MFSVLNKVAAVSKMCLFGHRGKPIPMYILLVAHGDISLSHHYMDIGPSEGTICSFYVAKAI